MTTAAVAKAFTDMLKAGDHHGAAAAFNSPDIVSLEARDGPMARVQGAEAVKAKSDWWEANNEVTGGATTGPFINGDQFAVHFVMDVTDKTTGKSANFTEIGLYTVKDGKIVEERFLY
jgi:ketosteroid isomerase-like protein